MSNKKVIIYSYYSPEEITGVGKYNGEMISWLLSNNIDVLSITNAPFYPYWKLYPNQKNRLISFEKTDHDLIRTYVYIPEAPGALKKIISELSFLISSLIAIMLRLKAIRESDLFIVINPPFFLGFVPFILCKIFKTPLLFHIQDLQVDAARELNLLPNWLCNFLELFEIFLLKKTDYISTISAGMKKKIEAKKVGKEPILIKNWANLSKIHPMDNQRWLHKKLSIDTDKKLIIYSGNIGKKQGLEIILEAAKNLENRSDLVFVILGEGLYKQKLKKKVAQMKLKNLVIDKLVETKDLNDMLNSSYIQLVVQKSEGADSFLPSKLTNILAAGCCSIVTADEGTSLYNILEPTKASRIISPDSSEGLISAIEELTCNKEKWKAYKSNSKRLADNELGIDGCLKLLLDLI